MSFLRLKPSTSTASALKAHLSGARPNPLHLQSLNEHWPASSLWTIFDGLQSLRDSVGETKEVDVELGKKGRGYLDPEYQRISMGFGQSLVTFLNMADGQDFSWTRSYSIVYLPTHPICPRATLLKVIYWTRHLKLQPNVPILSIT